MQDDNGVAKFSTVSIWIVAEMPKELIKSKSIKRLRCNDLKSKGNRSSIVNRSRVIYCGWKLKQWHEDVELLYEYCHHRHMNTFQNSIQSSSHQNVSEEASCVFFQTQFPISLGFPVSLKRSSRLSIGRVETSTIVLFLC